MTKLDCFPPSAFSLRSNFPKLVFGHLHLCGFPSFASINKQFKAKILGPMGSRKKKSRLLTRGLISLRAFCPMINVLGTLGFTTICRQNFLKSLKKKVFSGPLELNWRAVGWHLLIKIRAGNSRLSYPFQLLSPFLLLLPLKWSLPGFSQGPSCLMLPS